MKKKIIYCVAPKHPNNVWTLERLVYTMKKSTLMPNAAIATLIALTPKKLNIEFV